MGSPLQTQVKMRSTTTVGELCDQAVDKFFKDKKYPSVPTMLGGNNSASSRNGSKNAGYFGSWNSTRGAKNTVGGQFWSNQGPNQQKDHFGQQSRKQERKPNLRF